MGLFPYVLIGAVLEETFKRPIPEGLANDGCDRLAGQSTREKISGAVVLPCPQNREVALQIEGIYVSRPGNGRPRRSESQYSSIYRRLGEETA